MKLEKREKLAHLYDSYRKLLPQSQKQILHLYLIEDLTIAEISDILATTRQAINDAIKKGAKRLLQIDKNIK